MAELFSYIDPRGVETLLNNNTSRYKQGHVGLGMRAAEVITERTPGLDGTQFYGVYTGPRDISLLLDYQYGNFDDLIAGERALCSLVSPYITSATTYAQALGTLRVMRASATRDIDALLVGYEDNSQDRQFCTASRLLTFHCPDPFFYDPTLQSQAFALPVSSGLSIPLSIPVSIAAGAAAGSIYVTNAGDVDTWPTIRIDGPSDNPTITNVTTNKVLAITQAMDANDYITVNMETPSITFWDNSAGTSTAIWTMSAASEFWPLVRGENEISILVANPAGGSVTVSWYNRYLGA